MGMPLEADVLGGLSEIFRLTSEANVGELKRIATEQIWLALTLCFASGILTSFTPCVYPVIPITINIFGRAAQKHGRHSRSGFNNRTFFLAVVYVAGMCTTYSIMGVIAGMTGSLFGGLLQSAWVLGLFAIAFIALALGQLGLFKIALPGSLQTKLSSIGDSESLPGIFLMGVISGLIVSPCVGPVVAGILAFVFESSNALKGFLYFFSFSLGLGVLFLLLGGFSGLLTKLPRSGNWMTFVNRLLAVLLLGAGLYYGSLWAKQVGILKTKSDVTTTQGLTWLSNEKEAMALAKEKKLPVIVDFTADWCEACHVLDQTVFNNAAVAPVLDKFVRVRFDVTTTDEEKQALLDRYGVSSLPTVVFVDTAGQILQEPRVHGVLSVENFLAMLEKVKSR